MTLGRDEREVLAIGGKQGANERRRAGDPRPSVEER